MNELETTAAIVAAAETAATVPSPRRAVGDVELWPTSRVMALRAAQTGSTLDSARRWLTRHPGLWSVSREPGVVGENLYVAATVRRVLRIEE